MTVWAFNKPEAEEDRKAVYQAIQTGQSRFGWSWDDKNNLRQHYWAAFNSKQRFLLRIKPGDWIVHVNLPSQGKCTAVQVLSEYTFDQGLAFPRGSDFRHCIGIDPATIITFNRNDPNVLPSVNLKLPRRCYRVLAVADFLTSIENLKTDEVHLKKGESRQKYHLKKKTDEYLLKIAELIQSMNKSKDLERFIADVFRQIPGVKIIENGFGWGTDHGADLIIDICTAIGHLQFENRIIVQIKSYTGNHSETDAVEQVKTGLAKYSGTAGMIITTAKKTPGLENKIQAVSDELDLQIDLLDAEDAARFVIKHAPDLLFNLEGIS